MNDFDPEDMGPAMTAFVPAILGSFLMTGAIVMWFVFSPAALILFALGALFLFISPVIGILVWLDQRGESDES